MKHPAFDTIPRALLFVSIFILTGTLIPLCLVGMIPVNIGILLLQGFISGLLICGISVFLWYITRFTRLSGSTPIQGFLNHFALLCLTLSVWLGTEYMLFYLFFPHDIFQVLTTILPFKIVIGLLIFLLVIIIYSKRPFVEPVESIEDDIEMLLESKATSKSSSIKPTDKISVKSGSNINILPVTDLLYLQAEGDYVILYTAAARFIKEETMKHIEEQLPPFFIRIHRSCIVNTNYISRIELYEKQYYKITLKTGQQLRASATGYKVLKENLHL